MPDIHTEITFKTARSGGKGGQHVNKVETMVEGYWSIARSQFFTAEEKERLILKLAKKINADGYLLIKSQTARTQLANKAEVIKKMNQQVAKALLVPKKRKATKPGKKAVANRLEAKKKIGEKKSDRQKIKISE